MIGLAVLLVIGAASSAIVATNPSLSEPERATLTATAVLNIVGAIAAIALSLR